jgi:hypothetical protein
MKKLYPVTFLLLLASLFCQHINSPEPIPNIAQPGYFSLTLLEGLHKTSLARITASDTNTINLGDLHSTSSYYFLLTNSGGRAITNINLSISDSSFLISPTSIDSLTVGLGTQSLVPIIKLIAVHGTGAQGLGSEPLMSPGIHQVHLNISGTTKRDNIDTTVSLIATININALVMNLDIHTMAKDIDLYNMPLISGAWRFDNFIISTILGDTTSGNTDSIVTIINTGNIYLKVKTIATSSYDGSFIDSTSRLIGSDNSANFIIPVDSNLWGTYLTFCIDGDNTVCDPNKLQLQSNGKAYFIIARLIY